MDRTDLLFDLYLYKTKYHEEKLFLSSIIELIEKEPECFNRSLLSGHITGSAWVVNELFSKSILVFHAKLGRWLQPGGHADGDENITGVAARELGEETGLKRFRLFNESIFDIDIHIIPKYKEIPAHSHFDIRYLFVADDTEEIKSNHESLNAKWWNLEDLEDHVKDDNSMMRLIKKTKTLKLLLGY